MKKVLIIGSVASGKTTLAKRLSNLNNVPWYELDSIVYQRTATKRYKRTADEQIEVIMNIEKNGNWIFEGTDRQSYQCLYELADTIIFLDIPLWRRRVRIFLRYLKQQLGIEKCHYKSDMSMLKMMYKWTQDFERSRDEFEKKLQLYQNKVIRLYDNTDLNLIVELKKR